MKNSFTLLNAQALDPSYWTVGVPPLYVDKVYYGNILIVTVDEKPNTLTAYNNIDTQTGPVPGFDQLLSALISDSSRKHYVFSSFPSRKSAFTSFDLSNGNWILKLFYNPFPASEILRPISFILNDFKLQVAKIANNVNYGTQSCIIYPAY